MGKGDQKLDGSRIRLCTKAAGSLTATSETIAANGYYAVAVLSQISTRLLFYLLYTPIGSKWDGISLDKVGFWRQSGNMREW